MRRSPSNSLYTQLIAGTLFPLHERLKRHDSPSKLEALERTQWLTAVDIARMQSDGLGEFLDRVTTRHPYWKAACASNGLTPSTFGDTAAFQRLPLTDKAVLRNLAKQWKPERGEKFRMSRTSGSTGEPLQFPIGLKRVTHDVAAKWRATRWWGVDIGDREIVLWASPMETQSQTALKSVRDWILRSQLLPVRAVDRATLRRYLEVIRRSCPQMMFGYPSMLAQLGRAATDLDLELERGPKVVFVTSEVLHSQWRDAIEKGFNTRVANEYGARDSGFLARECPMGRMHVNAEDILIEIVDDGGKRVPAGELGDIVVTNLCTETFPFIRYRTGDIGRFANESCPCGRALPIIAEIVGRENDWLLSTNGALVHGSAFNYVLRSIPQIDAYQIRQSRRDFVAVLIKTWSPISADERDRIVVAYRSLLGSDVTLDLRELDYIRPDARVKQVHDICDVEDQPRRERVLPVT